MVALSLANDDVLVDNCAGLGDEDEGVELRHESQDAIVLRFVDDDEEFLRGVCDDVDALFANDGVPRCDDDNLSELECHEVNDAIACIH